MKDIKNYEGLYAITSCGKVWSYRAKKFLKSYDSRGYLKVRLCKNGEEKQFTVHRLVAEAYIPNPDPEHKKYINHKDEVKTHNWINNLEWVTLTENNNYGTRNERAAKTLSKPVYCVELDRIFESQKAAAKEMGLYRSALSYCCNGKRKTAGGYHWRFATESEITAHKLKTSLDELTNAVKMDLHLERIGQACNSLLESAC